MSTTTESLQGKADAMAKALMRPVNAVLLAQVHAELQRKTVDALKRELLEEVEYFTDDSHPAFGARQRITEPKDTWLMSEEDSRFFLDEKWQRMEERGMTHNLEKDHCPALVAEHLQVQAEHVLLHAAAEFFPEVTVNGLLCLGLKKYRQFIDLMIGLVVNHPTYEKPRL